MFLAVSYDNRTVKALHKRWLAWRSFWHALDKSSKLFGNKLGKKVHFKMWILSEWRNITSRVSISPWSKNLLSWTVYQRNIFIWRMKNNVLILYSRSLYQICLLYKASYNVNIPPSLQHSPLKCPQLIVK